jgi:uncharacterized protein (TIGR01777 family)
MNGERGRIVITGGTGLIGGRLAAELAAAGHDVVVLTRDPERAEPPPGARAAGWDAETAAGWGPLADGALGIVHLAGEPIDGRWTAARKHRIRASRVRSSRAVLAAIEAARTRPRWLLQGSAVGYYGTRGEEPVTEEAGPGADYLAEVSIEWEAATAPAESLGVRRAILRTGLVLAAESGLLARMLTPFRLGLGGPLGSGRQYMPWIHLADEIAAIRFLARTEAARGPFNLAAPEPVTNAEFTRTLARVLRRPAVFRVPGFALRLARGEMADLALAGQRAVPRALEALGFRFRFPALEPALRDLLS